MPPQMTDIDRRVIDLISTIGQAKVARILKCSPQKVNHVIKGRQHLSVADLATLVSQCDISEHYVLFGDGPKLRSLEAPPMALKEGEEQKSPAATLATAALRASEGSGLAIGGTREFDHAVHVIRAHVAQLKNQKWPELLCETPEATRKRMEEMGERPDLFVPLPFMEDAVAAGPPREVSDQRIQGWVIIYKKWVPKPAQFAAVRVRGDSMAPILHDGSIAGVDFGQRDPINLRNRIILASDGEGGTTIKWLDQDKTHWILRPENPNFQAIILEKRDVANPILGRVAWAWSYFR